MSKIPETQLGRIHTALPDLFVLIALVVVIGPAHAATIEDAPKLTRIGEVLNLPPEALAEHRSVRVAGVVTAFGGPWNVFFMQDRTGGIRIIAPSRAEALRAGERIEVIGEAVRGRFAPAVFARAIHRLGNGRFPAPLRVPWSQITNGAKEGQWVEVAGTVRSVASENNLTAAEIVSGGERMTVYVEGLDRAILVDSKVRLRGVNIARFNSGEFIGAVVYVPDPLLVQTEMPAPSNPFEQAPISYDEVLRYRDGESAEHRVHVVGTVELFRPGISIFLVDGTDHLFVATAGRDALQPGDRIEVAGFPSFIQGSPGLSDAAYRRLGAAPPPIPVTVAAEDILNPKNDLGLIRFEGKLLHYSFKPEEKSWLLQTGNQVFEALLESEDDVGKMASLEPDSILGVTGVCVLFRDNEGNPNGLRVRLRSMNDLQILQRPSWWTARRALTAVAFLGVTVFAVLAWTISLRRRVRGQTEIIRLRLEREAALEQRYQDLVENANDVICTVNLEGVLKSLNSEGERLLGYSREEIVGGHVCRLLAPESGGCMTEVLKTASRGGNLPAREVEVVSRQGQTVPLEVSLRVMWEDGRPVGLECIARDITERRRAEQDKAALAEQLRQSQKMEAIGQLAGGVAHDFNNLLTVINGYTELLLGDLPTSDRRRLDLEHIRDAGVRAASLTSQLLAFSRRQILQPVVLDLNDAVGMAGKILRRLIGEDIILTVSTHASDRSIKADPGQIQQIIMNLAINARDAMPEGGQLKVETFNDDLDEKLVRQLGEGNAGRYVVLAIKDDGIGMDEQTRLRIFEPFFTTKGVGKGTGLGLSTVYGIVRQSDGFITVVSEPGKGTTFQIYLPCVERSGGSEALEIVGSTAAPRGRRETVLLVEDEESVRELVARALKAHGFNVVEAASGPAALREAGAFKGRIDLLLTDVVMPEMNGKELAMRFKAVRPDTRVLFVSGYTDNVVRHEGAQDPSVAFLEKPFTSAVLARTIRDLLDAGISLSSGPVHPGP